jgi:TolB-like protein/predicted Ser/Thr protein kinase
MASRTSGQDSLIGFELGRYRIVERIGVGGMGEVYRARDQHLDRDVALKVLPPGSLANDHARNLFRKEAHILSRLNHPNVATIFDFETRDGMDVLVMEYIAGTNLSEKIAGYPLPQEEVVSLGAQLADGLAAAHECGIVHRDLKPGNLRVCADGRLKILDFGIAKLLHVTTSGGTELPSETGSVSGTIPYMAPEQLRGEKADARSDIHSAGCVLYQMATGRRAFPDIDISELIGAILNHQPTPPSELNRALSPQFDEIIAKCLEKDPRKRYQSAKELAADLRALGRNLDLNVAPTKSSSTARTRTTGAFPISRIRRRTVIGVIAGVLILAVAAVLAFWAVRGNRTAGSSPVGQSIAVLPFDDLSPAKDQEYFSDGLADELLNDLVKIPGLRVAARTSSFQFKAHPDDLKAIGKKLNVDSVLEGSVRKQGRRARISIQLVQVSNGFQLWSDVYDRDLTDIFTVQEEIAQAVASALKIKLLNQKAPSPQPTSVEAYNAYLKGKYFYSHLSKENLEKAISYFEQTISSDPNYAPAWAALSKARSVHAGAYGPLDEYGSARQAAERALTLDAKLPDAYAAMGEIKLDYDWDWAGADAAYQQALALDNSGNGEIVARAASVAATLNHWDRAMPLSQRAVELDPLGVSAYYLRGFNAWWDGQLDEAQASIHRGLEIDPQFPWLHGLLTRVYLAKGRLPEALAEAEKENDPVFHMQSLTLVHYAMGRKRDSDQDLANLIAQNSTTAAFQIAEAYAFRGETEEAFGWLEKAYTQHDGGLTFVKGDPLLANIAQDPRYAEFLKKMRLA